MIQLNKHYKTKKNFTALGNSERQFEKKDYSFEVVGFGDHRSGIDAVRGVQFDYHGEIYSVPNTVFADCTKPALTIRDVEKHLILKYIGGSKMYGTNRADSDTDYRGVYVLPEKYYSAYEFDPDNEEIKEKDLQNNAEYTYYSLRKFMSLIEDQNPNILESMNIPADCLIFKDPIVDTVLKFSKHFSTKKCYYTFLNYGASQIQKARGQDKLQNWDKTKIDRKTVLDFCYVFRGQGSVPVKDFLHIGTTKQEDYGLVKVPHMRDIYAAFYGQMNKYRGIVTDVEKANDVCTSSVEIGAETAFYISFNKDGYSKHCADYKKYQQWQREKNDGRWVDVKDHDQKIDGKNMLHCLRLIYMAEDIANGKGIVVRRPEAEYLKTIRLGAVNLDALLEEAQTRLDALKLDFERSDLPNEVNHDFIETLYRTVKNEYWQRKKEIKKWTDADLTAAFSVGNVSGSNLSPRMYVDRRNEELIAAQYTDR